MRISTITAAAALALAATAATAQDYPTGPITIVVPFAAGGPTDTVTRLIAEPMSKRSASRSSCRTSAAPAARSAPPRSPRRPPDGYTLLLHHIGMSTAPSLYADLAYDPVRTSRPSASSPACR